MRTAVLPLNGKEYLLCFSARVVRSCTERYGGIENIGDALDAGHPAKALDETFWLLAQMMDAGARYAKLEGLENPAPLSFDQMYDLCGMDDLAGFKGKIFETVANGRKSTIEVEASKNAETTQAV